MQTTEKRVNRKGRSAFTLVELMVVVAIISILIGGVFKLLGAAGEKSKESVTVSRMEKLQNALSGYYAEFGSYPPVMQFECPDPDLQRKSADRTKFEPAEGQPWEKANRAAHSQSVVYEFPTVRGLDPFIDLVFKGTARSAGIAFAGSAIKSDSWYSVQVRSAFLSLAARAYCVGYRGEI